MKEKVFLVLIPIAIITISFLYFNFSHEIQFSLRTGILFPLGAQDIRGTGDEPSFNGDGLDELTFVIPENEINAFLAKKPFNKEWESGPYTDVKTKRVKDIISVFPDSHEVSNGEGIYYQVSDRSPEGQPYTNFFLIVFEPKTGIVLFHKDDS
jgi:hypothetical protein